MLQIQLINSFADVTTISYKTTLKPIVDYLLDLNSNQLFVVIIDRYLMKKMQAQLAGVANVRREKQTSIFSQQYARYLKITQKKYLRFGRSSKRMLFFFIFF